MIQVSELGLRPFNSHPWSSSQRSPLPSLQMPLTLPQTEFIFSSFIYFELLWYPILEPPFSTTQCGGEKAGCGATWDWALVQAPNFPWVKNSGPFKMCARELPSPTSHCRGEDSAHFLCLRALSCPQTGTFHFQQNRLHSKSRDCLRVETEPNCSSKQSNSIWKIFVGDREG